MSAARHEATTPEIKTSVGGPEMNLVDVDNVLEGLASNCFYLNWERNRYRFGLSPNLNQMLVTRRGAVSDKEIDERIREQTQKLFDKSSSDACKQLDRKYWPNRSNDIPSRAVLTLVVLGLESSSGDKATTELMESIVRDCGTSGRTFKSAVIFSVPDAGENVREAARSTLAWEDIDEDEDTKKRVDDGQTNLLKRNLANARRDLDEGIFRAYRHTFLLGKDNKLRHVDLGQITSSSAGSIVELILRELIRNDEVTEGVGVNKLLKYWPPALVEWSTKAARDAFYSSPQLPRLLNPDAIRRTISDGVAAGQLGLATKDANGRLKLQKLRESLIDVDVDISDDVFILKAEDAQKLKEPPRLATLIIRPDNVVITVGDQVGFECSAIDQYGQEFKSPALTWTATGGMINDSGMFTAGEGTGLFAIHARGGGIEGVTEVRIQAKRADASAGARGEIHQPGKRLLRWRGAVPPQKWMNFYTKILSRFASSPDLRLEVNFDVLLDSEQAKGRADETRSGLKELGIDNDVELT